MKSLELKAYPLDGEFMASIKMEEASDFKSNIQTVIILDKSGSMEDYSGDNVTKTIREILPKFFSRLSYDQNQHVYLILFDEKTIVYKMWVREFSRTTKTCGGGTKMGPALRNLGELFNNFSPSELVRVLTISDGEIFDRSEVEKVGALVAKQLSKTNIRVNSQAVRLFTSFEEPDTTALCSVLRFNNTVQSRLCDIRTSESADSIADKMADLFVNDNLVNALKLTSESFVFLKLPWESETSKEILITPGQNIFWMKSVPDVKFCVGEKPVKVSIQEPLTLVKFHALLDSKLAFIIDHLKVLKIVGTAEASEIVDRAFEYIEEKEKFLAQIYLETGSLNPKNLQDRVKTLKRASDQHKRFTNILSTIANDENVNKLNSAQKAEYLREIDINKNSKGLARRAVKKGFDFDEIARAEVLKMAEKFSEISDIDDSQHSISFYSQETTFGGIKCLVELANEGSIELFDVNAIIQLLNIVGVSCNGPIGNFPDAMTWKVNEIFPGCNVSVSDILVAHQQSSGTGLKSPIYAKDITNVIPFFDDERIGSFLKKYAPSLLDYTSSIGMRRIICEVPMTAGYTISAGILKMIQEINTNKSSLFLEVFEKLVMTYRKFVGRYFESVTDLVKPQEDKNLAFFIGNNGLANFISTFIEMYKENKNLNLIPDILRALFNYEVWQVMRRSYKNKEFSENIAKNMLHKLLGIDLEKNKFPVKELFVDEPDLSEIKFHDKPEINLEYLNELYQPLNHVKLLVRLPEYIEAVVNGSIETIKEVPELSDEKFLKALDIKYNHKLYLFFNAFQALFHTTSASRFNNEDMKMKIIDLKNEKNAKKEVRKYIKREFEAFYLAEIAAKKKIEEDLMGKKVADKIVASNNYEEMVEVWANGITVNNTTYKISNSSSNGFNYFVEKVFDASTKAPERLNIIKVLLLGVDNGEQPVWNNGGVYFMPDLKSFHADFLQFFSENEWKPIMRVYAIRNYHIYREKPNRNGHSNQKPSFWAMGYSTLQTFYETVSKEEFEEYCRIHYNCCGIKNLKKITDES